MRALLAWALLPLLLGGLLPSSAVASPPVVVVFPPSGSVGTSFVLDASFSCCAVGAEALRNPAFDQGLASWSTSGQRAPNLTVAAEGGGVRMRLQGPAEAGSLLAFQTLPADGRAQRVAWTVSGEGTGVGFSVTVKETLVLASGARQESNTTFRAPLPAKPTAFERTWMPTLPGATQLTLILRAEHQPRANGTLLWDGASMRPTETVAWRGGEGATLTPEGAAALARFSTAGVHEVEAAVTRLNGTVESSKVAVRVTNAPPSFDVASLAALVGDEVELAAANLTDPDAPELLANGGFRDGAAGWRGPPSQPAAALSVGRHEGRLGMKLDGLHAVNGSTTLIQTFTLVPNASYDISADVAAVGAVTHQWVLRERAGERASETTLLPAVRTAWTRASFAWSPTLPNATQADLILVAKTTSGGQAWYANVSVVPVPALRWDLDGDGVPDATGASVKRVFEREGAFLVRVTARDFLGAEASREARVEVRSSAFSPVLEGPRVALAGQRARFVVDGVAHGPNLVVSPTFADLRGWTLNHSLLGGPLAASVDHGILVLDAGPVAKEGSFLLSQRVPLSSPGPFAYRVRLEDDGGVQRYELVLREGTATSRPDEGAELKLSLPGAPGGRVVQGTWQPTQEGATLVRFVLRAWVAPGAPTRIAVSEPLLAPLVPQNVSYAWGATGGDVAAASGRNVDVAFGGSGLARVEARALPGGEAASAHVLVLPEAPVATPRVDGTVLLRWSLGDALAAEHAWGPENRTGAPLSPRSVAGPNGTRAFEATVRREEGEAYVLAARVAGAGTFHLARFGPEALSPIVLQSAARASLSPLAPVVVVARVTDPGVEEVVVRLLSVDGGELAVASVPGRGAGDYRVELPVGAADLLQGASVDLTARAGNATASLRVEQALAGTPLPSSASASALAVTLGLVASMAAVEWWRRRA